MNEIDIKFDSPGFELEEKIYIICGPDHFIMTDITGFQSLVVKGSVKDDHLIAIPQKARISTYISDKYFEDIEEEYVPFKYLTKDENKAREWMKVYPISITEEEWLLMIGQRPTIEEIVEAAKNKTFDSEDSLEECELARCCANIADIRDCFIRCKKNGSMIGWEKENLQWLVDNSCHEKPENSPILDKVLKQLKIKWK